MELSKEQMKLVIAKLEGSYNSKTIADENYHLIGHLGNIDKKIEALI